MELKRLLLFLLSPCLLSFPFWSCTFDAHNPGIKKNTRALLEEINKWISFFFLVSFLEPVIISLTQGLVVMSSELEDVFGSMMVGRVRLRLFSHFTG